MSAKENNTDSGEPEEELLNLGYGDNENAKRAVLIAIILHLILFFVHFPTSGTKKVKKEEEEKTKIRRFKPMPPPKVKPKKIKKKDVKKKKVPVPDPTPDEPEPIVEPEPEPEPPPVPENAEVVRGIPEGPPAPTGPVGQDAVSTQPTKKTHVEPDYPKSAKRAQIEGRVILQITIDAEGNVTDVKVLRDAPMGLTEAAVKAAKQWKYSPAIMNGEPVGVRKTVTVNFSLD